MGIIEGDEVCFAAEPTLRTVKIKRVLTGTVEKIYEAGIDGRAVKMTVVRMPNGKIRLVRYEKLRLRERARRKHADSDAIPGVGEDVDNFGSTLGA